MVNWVRSGKRWNCHNPDGSDHWDACSAERWRIVKSEGKRFETEKEAGYIYKGRKHLEWRIG